MSTAITSSDEKKVGSIQVIETPASSQHDDSGKIASSVKEEGHFDELGYQPGDELYIDPEEEKRVLRKLDYNILPILALMYFLAALDRSNIGNAGAAGLKKAIGIDDSQFSTCVSIFYATYVVSEVPATLLLKRLKPHLYLSVLIFCWSIITIGTSWVSSYGSLIACRLLLGLFEGGYFPSMTVYVSMIYKKQEQGRRISYLLSAAAFSGAFGGLIAAGFLKVHTKALSGFRFIFLVEGCITVAAVAMLYFWLPDDPTEAHFFNEREKEVMRIRAKQREKYMGAEKFEWIEVKKAYMDPKTYFSMIIQFCQDLILYGFSTFLPSILKLGLGFDNLRAQYLTIPVYFVAGVSYIIAAYFSDRINVRGPFFFCYNIIAIVGYIILLSCHNNGVKYFATYLIAFPLYAGPGLNLAWTSNNSAPHYRRTTTIGSNQTLGNLSGAIAGQIYRSSPYVLGNAFSLGCLCVSCICIVCNSLWIRKLNNDKRLILAGEKEDNKKERTGDDELNFVYCY